ncbi:hypothetical protein MTO96_004601 [Rhipicephalus appendiculatus]
MIAKSKALAATELQAKQVPFGPVIRNGSPRHSLYSEAASESDVVTGWALSRDILHSDRLGYIQARKRRHREACAVRDLENHLQRTAASPYAGVIFRHAGISAATLRTTKEQAF